MGSMSAFSALGDAVAAMGERHALVVSERRELLERQTRFGLGAVRNERLRAVGGVVLEQRR